MEVYQWLAPVICLLLMVRTVRQYIRGRRRLLSAFIWVGMLVLFSSVALLPADTTAYLASLLGFESNINALLFVTQGLLFLIVFQQYQSVQGLERRIEELVRALAKEESSTD